MSWPSAFWGKLQSLGFFVFVAIVGCGIALLFVPLMHQRHEMQMDIGRLEHEIEQQDALDKKHMIEIESLKNDSSFIERTARNKLNLARPNEVIFRFEAPPAAVAQRR